MHITDTQDNMSESLLFQWARHMHKVTRNFLASHTHGHNGSEDSEEDDAPPPQPTPRRAPAPPAVARAQVFETPRSENAAAGPSTPQSSSQKHGGPGTGRKRGSYMKDGPTVYKLIKPCMRAIKEAKTDE